MSDYSFKRTYLLSQQTPLIHFQYDQDGATLRATEVKPKLDKYLIERFKDENPGKAIPDEWWINPKKDEKTGEVIVKALNYRMTILMPDLSVAGYERLTVSNTHLFDVDDFEPGLVDIQGKARIRINSMYFGNTVSKEDNNQQRLSGPKYKEQVDESYKETVFYDDKGTDEKIQLTIICRNEGLLNKIDESVETFFTLYNFGTRQSKGFGGFKLIGIKGNTRCPPTNPLILMQNSNVPFFYIDLESELQAIIEKKQTASYHSKSLSVADIINIKMDLAAAVYSVMKGGINRTTNKVKIESSSNFKDWRINKPKAYVKGYIQRKYLDDAKMSDIGSEKAKIKASILKGKDKSGNWVYSSEKYNQYLFVRALLGMTDQYKYSDKKCCDSRRTGTVKVYSLGSSSFDIERFQSLATIKIIDNYVFFWFTSDKSILDKILNKEIYLVLDNEYFRDKWKNAKDYPEKKRVIVEFGKKINTPKTIDWPFFIKHFINYFKVESAKTDVGMILCGYPFDEARNIVLQNGCESK